MHSQRHGHAGRYAALTVALVSVACADSTSAPSSSLSPARQNGAAGLSAADTTWDYFSADMTLNYEGGGIAGQPALPRRAMAMRVERSLGSDGEWSGKFTFFPSPTPGRLRRPIASSAISDASGMRLLDATGKVMELPPEVSRLLPGGSGSSARASSRRGASREWLDNIMPTLQSRERTQSRFRRGWGNATSKNGDRSTYRVSRGNRVTEFDVDDVLGAVVESRFYQGSTLQARVTNTYEPIGFGTYVRRTARAVSMPLDSRVRETVLEIRIDNLRFEKRGGKQP